MNKFAKIGIILLLIVGAFLICGVATAKDTTIYSGPQGTLSADLSDAYHHKGEGVYIADDDSSHERGLFVLNKTPENEKLVVDMLDDGKKVQKHVWKIGTTEKLVNSFNVWGQTVKLDKQNVYAGFVQVGDFIVVFVGNNCELEAERVLSSVHLV